MLEKDKNCIEFSMHSMMATHKPYQEDTEIAITGMAPGKSFLLANNPFDIPCDVVMVSKSYFERLQAENEQLKKKLDEFDPMPGYRELLKELYSTEDVEKLEWTLNHICGGQASVNGWMVSSKLWRRNYETLSKLVGFSSVEEIQDYLTNEAECDTLQEAVLKLKDQVKYTCDEWYSANSTNNSWKAAAECNSPKELIEKREALEKEIEVYSRALKEWKEGTGCPSPSATKSLIESGASWHQAYRDVKKANEKLADDVESWKNVTGYSTPEDYMHARISGAFHTPFDYTAAWQKATSCETPEEAKELISSKNGGIVELKNRLDASLTANEQLKKKLQEFDVTFALSFFWKEKYETFRNALKAWREATGCNTPEEAETTIRNLRGRIDEMKEFASIASNWTDRIVEG